MSDDDLLFGGNDDDNSDIFGEETPLASSDNRADTHVNTEQTDLYQQHQATPPD